MAKPKATYTIHEYRHDTPGLRYGSSYLYIGELHGAKRRASLNQKWPGSTLIITVDEHQVAIRGIDGWYDPRDCTA